MDDDRAETDSEEMLTDESSSSTPEKKKSNYYKPLCTVRILSIQNSRYKWDEIKREMISSLNKKTRLIIFFHAFYSPLNYFPSKQCICTLVNSDTHIITMRDRHIVEEKKKMYVLYIPLRHELHINLYYYFKKRPINENYNVVAFNNRDNKKATSLLKDMISEIIANRLWNVCFILLGDLASLFKELFYFVQCVKDSDRTRQIPIISGAMNDLMFCDEVTCRSKVCGIIIAIKGYYMKAWTLSFDEWCNTEEQIKMKFLEFENRVELKKYSFGYRSYGISRNQSLIILEKKIFKETFPTVDLFTIHGSIGYAADDLNEMPPLLEGFYEKKYSSKSSQIMLITYN